MVSFHYVIKIALSKKYFKLFLINWIVLTLLPISEYPEPHKNVHIQNMIIIIALHISKFKLFLSVPMYDVDLMWHTHQLFPLIYERDTTALLGYLLNHDDETTDRSPGSKLATSDSETRALWKQVYGEHFVIPGVLNRGESPVGRLFHVSWYHNNQLWPSMSYSQGTLTFEENTHVYYFTFERFLVISIMTFQWKYYASTRDIMYKHDQTINKFLLYQHIMTAYVPLDWV